tara:strand:- start:3693 stop:4457 length:765 start_codon:yes stop_codon:yes gene_type:complete
MENKKKEDNDLVEKFFQERELDIKKMGEDYKLKEKSLEWMLLADKYKYTYNFTWMGRPIIKYPNDMVIQQEIMWKVKPDLIIETGIAHGGSIIFSSSMMKMMDIEGEVVGIDIDIREHNKNQIINHKAYDRISMYEGDSTNPNIIKKVEKHIKPYSKVMVILDSNHSHKHVLKELEIYSRYVTKGSFCILPDTFIEFFPKGYYSKDRPWDVGNNPYTAMKEFMKNNNKFKVSKFYSDKANITETIDGYLERISL